MAGPWFTVQESGNTWETIETIWISNGDEHQRVHVQLWTRLEDYDDEM